MKYPHGIIMNHFHGGWFRLDFVLFCVIFFLGGWFVDSMLTRFQKMCDEWA